MVTLLALFLATQVPVEQPPRLRTILPNGVAILVERVPKAKSLIVDLFVSSRGTEESPSSHGRRHLMEHLIAGGPAGDIDRRIETAGGLLRPRTFRDSMEFSMNLPPSGLALGLGVIKELLKEPKIEPGAIEAEAHIIEEEGALREAGSRISERAWSQSFGDRGLDPFGDVEILRSTTVDQVRILHRKSFVANHLSIVVSGDIDLDKTTKAVADVLSFVPGAKPALGINEIPPTPTFGHDRDFLALPVSGYRGPDTAGALAAALALSTLIPGSSVIYTPSGRPSLITLASPNGVLSDEFGKANPIELFGLGKVMATRWVQIRLAEPEEEASFRGMLLVESRDLRPEIMLENLAALPFAEFKKAVEAFKNCQTMFEVGK